MTDNISKDSRDQVTSLRNGFSNVVAFSEGETTPDRRSSRGRNGGLDKFKSKYRISLHPSRPAFAKQQRNSM